ncbi:MAG: hypothetical protein WCV73_01705 [Patescibacteria group bacterium]
MEKYPTNIPLEQTTTEKPFETSLTEEQKETERKTEALKWFVDQAFHKPKINESTNFEQLSKWCEFVLNHLLKSKEGYNRANGCPTYLASFEYIGSQISDSDSEQIDNILMEIKKTINENNELKEWLIKASNPKNMDDILVKRNLFFDNISFYNPATSARIYHPSGLKKITENVFELEENISIDEMYESYLGYLTRSIEFALSKGSKPEDDAGSANGLKRYLSVYEKMTGKPFNESSVKSQDDNTKI